MDIAEIVQTIVVWGFALIGLLSSGADFLEFLAEQTEKKKYNRWAKRIRSVSKTVKSFLQAIRAQRQGK